MDDDPDRDFPFRAFSDRLAGRRFVAQSKGKSFYLSEYGGPTAGTLGGTKIPMTEQQQSDMLMQAFRRSAGAATWITAILWYTWADKGTDADDTESWFGIVGPASGGFVAKTALAEVSKIKRGS